MERKELEEQKRQVVEDFREVFTSEKGKRVLNILLDDLHYFNSVNSAEEMALSNYARFFLNVRLGIKNTVAITDCLLSGKVELYEDEKEKKEKEKNFF